MPALLPGPAYALLTAVCWAIAVILFKKSGEAMDPIGLNLFKNLIGWILLVATMLLFGAWPPRLPLGDAGWLLLSGAIGIGLADSLFFMSLNLLGASRQAIVDCSYSPVIVLFSYVLLGERLEPWDLAGGGLILAALLLVGAGRGTPAAVRRRLMVGFAYGTASMLSMGLAIVAVKPLLERYDVMATTFVRLSGGIVALALLALVSPRARAGVAAVLRPQAAWRHAVPGAFMGTYLSLLCWIAGFKYNSASVAAILNQTATLFIVLLAAVFLGERLGARGVLAVALGCVGSLFVLL